MSEQGGEGDGDGQQMPSTEEEIFQSQKTVNQYPYFLWRVENRDLKTFSFQKNLAILLIERSNLNSSAIYQTCVT